MPSPGHQIYIVRGDFGNFLLEFEEAARLSQDAQALSIATAAKKGFSAGGSRGMLESMLAVQKDLYVQGKQPPYLLARTCSRLGRQDEAFAYLQAALDKREMSILGVGVDMAFTNLHNDPAWRGLVARVGLPRQ